MSIKHCMHLFQKLNINKNARIATLITRPPNTASIFTTCRKLGLEEFFEDQENWSKEEIKVGRSWRLSDLRIKSNEDLHKIWYILLKEKNMLLTMEHYCKENYILFPNPERIDKVEESMKNLESVVRERNKAYYQLETGETGERPGKVIYDRIGMKHWHRMTQHFLPKAGNPRWKMNHLEGYDINECEDFLRLFREKNLKEKRGMLREDVRYLRGLMRRYPKLDLEYLQKLYPKINVKALSTRVRGHYENRFDNDNGYL